MSENPNLIKQFIIDAVAGGQTALASHTAKAFRISPQAAGKHVRDLVEMGVLHATGKTRSRRYTLRAIEDIKLFFTVSPSLEEHVPWQNEVRPKLSNVPENVLTICSYGFTEMLNNVVDHSASETVFIRCFYTAHSVSIRITDSGVGIFKKIKDALGLGDDREAILELAKGKFTTDPAHHTGEGVFFTSRIFDTFSMWSGGLFFRHAQDSDWLIESKQLYKGTQVDMTIAVNSDTIIKNVFDNFSSNPEDCTFSRTHVPLSLAELGRDNLISRSQAKRILSRFDKFEEVLLDFAGVGFIGQAFADEIFRVFSLNNPKVGIVAINANQDVKAMIERAKAAARPL